MKIKNISIKHGSREVFILHRYSAEEIRLAYLKDSKLHHRQIASG